MAGERISTRLRADVTARARGCCEYCRSQDRFSTHSFSVEHILPRSRGGTLTLDNLALSCQGCNNHKYIRTDAQDPISGVTVPLYHPRRDAWDEHFVWSDDYSLVIGISPVGRATVEALRLNRPGVVRLRRLLFEIGEHPRSGFA